MGAVEVGTGPISDLLGAEQPGELDNGPLAMHPRGLDRGQRFLAGESNRVEGMQGIGHGLVVAAKLLGDAGGTLPAGAGQQDRATRQDNGICGAHRFSSVVRSSSVRRRTKLAGLMPTSVPHSLPPVLGKH
jgi:hypothetical protein